MFYQDLIWESGILWCLLCVGLIWKREEIRRSASRLWSVLGTHNLEGQVCSLEEVVAISSITWMKRIPTGTLPCICSQGSRAACGHRSPVSWISLWTSTAVPSKCLTWASFLWCCSSVTHWFPARSHPGEEPEAFQPRLKEALGLCTNFTATMKQLTDSEPRKLN